MYVVNGIAHAGAQMQDILVQSVKPLDDRMMIITFRSGEKRLYDLTFLSPIAHRKAFRKKAGA